MRPPPTRPALGAGHICLQCRLQTSHRRAISLSFLEKKAEAQRQWEEWGREIRGGKRQSMLSILESRGYVKDITGTRHDLDQLLTNKRIGVYCGVDPTAPSLHIGHLLPLMALFWMHVHGFHTISLIGGATSRIGDPTGRSKDRPEMTNTERKANIVGIHYQLKKLWVNMEKTAARHGFEWEKYWHRDIVNNATWFNTVPFVDVLKYLGKGLRLGELLKRDTVKNKMESGDGVSFAEFCYPIMQAWDWWTMYDARKIQMQIGGSDQYGNILAGVDAVKWMARTHPDPDIRQEGGVKELTTPYGLTVPLLLTATGEKFGKSAGNAIWLDSNMTSYFDLYAFFVRTADADVERFLKLFTFLPDNQIQSVMDRHNSDTSKRTAQHTLAHEFLHLVHGHENATFARNQYEKHSSSRKTASLSSLVSASDLKTAPQMTEAQKTEPMTGESMGQAESEHSSPTSTKDETAPSHYSRDAFSPPAARHNPLSTNQAPSTRQQSTFTSPILNTYAPRNNPNNPSGAAAHIVLPASLIRNQSIAKVLYSAGLVTSRSEGHRLCQNQGAYIGRQSSGHKTMSDEVDFIPAKIADPQLTWSHLIRDYEFTDAMEKEGEEGLLVLRSGKWKIRMIRVVSNEKFEKMGLPDPPLWQERKSAMAALRAQEASDVDKGWRGKSRAASSDDVVDEAQDFVEPASKIHRKTAEASYREQVGKAIDTLEHRGRREASSATSDGFVPRHKPRRGEEEEQDKAYDHQTNTISQLPKSSKEKKSPSLHPAEARKRHAIKMSLLAEARTRGDRIVLDEMREEAKVAREAENERMERMRLRDEIRKQVDAEGLSGRAGQADDSDADGIGSRDPEGKVGTASSSSPAAAATWWSLGGGSNDGQARDNVETLLQKGAQDDVTRLRMARTERGLEDVRRRSAGGGGGGGFGSFGTGWRK